nr:protein NYNRIN-like [Tanacetum cinerariifolium]
EGGKQTPYQGSTVRIIGGGSLQAIIPYAIAKVTLSWRRLTPFIILCRNLKTSTLIWERLVVAVPLLILIYLFRIMKLSFDDDHIKEISSGSTTTHSDISLSEYDSFIFDFAHEEFTDELAHIISPPEYDRFCFWNLPDPGELMYVLNSEIRENLPSTTRVNLPIEDDYSPLLAYVVWIFLAYLTYLVIPPYLHPFGNEDTIFDPGITINHFLSFKPGSSHRHGAFKKFNTHRSHLNEWPMIINGKNTLILDPLTPITAPWLFYKWRIDIAGPFPEGPVKHPQSNGLVERANRSLGEGIKARLGEGNKKWVEELPHVLWAHRTMIKSSHGVCLPQ